MASGSLQPWSSAVVVRGQTTSICDPSRLICVDPTCNKHDRQDGEGIAGHPYHKCMHLEYVEDAGKGREFLRWSKRDLQIDDKNVNKRDGNTLKQKRCESKIVQRGRKVESKVARNMKSKKSKVEEVEQGDYEFMKFDERNKNLSSQKRGDSKIVVAGEKKKNEQKNLEPKTRGRCWFCHENGPLGEYCEAIWCDGYGICTYEIPTEKEMLEGQCWRCNRIGFVGNKCNSGKCEDTGSMFEPGVDRSGSYGLWMSD